jgi:hypothetical protein
VKPVKILAVLACIAAFIGLLTYLTLGGKQHRAKVCVEYQGRTNCGTATGPTREHAQRTATETACATIASGMTDSMSCSHKPPVSVDWLD